MTPRNARLILAALALLTLAGTGLVIALLGLPSQPSAPEASAPTSSPTTAASAAPSSTPADPSAPGPTTRTSAAPASSPVVPDFGVTAQTPQQKLALEAARVLTIWTPAEDLDESASEGRLKPMLTKDAAARVFVSDRGTSHPEWIRAAERGASSQPHLVLAPTDGPGQVVVLATWDWVAPDGERWPSQVRRQYTFSLTEGQNPQVSAYTWQNL